MLNGDHGSQRERESRRSKLVLDVLVYYFQSRTLEDQDSLQQAALAEVRRSAESYLGSLGNLSDPEQVVPR